MPDEPLDALPLDPPPDHAAPEDGTFGDSRDHAPRTTASAPRVVVLGAPAEVAAVARAVALRLAGAAGRHAAGVVATWVPDGVLDARTREPGASRPARGGAARLASALGDEGHASRAVGRLVHVQLGAGAVAEAERLHHFVHDAPLVLAVGGAREAAWDALLPQQDLVLLAVGPTVPPALATVALAGARDLCGGVPALAVDVGGGRRPRVSRDDLAAGLEHLVAR